MFYLVTVSKINWEPAVGDITCEGVYTPYDADAGGYVYVHEVRTDDDDRAEFEAALDDDPAVIRYREGEAEDYEA